MLADGGSFPDDGAMEAIFSTLTEHDVVDLVNNKNERFVYMPPSSYFLPFSDP